MAYPAGAGLVVHSVDSRVQRFISGGAEALGITAFAACPVKRVLALAERGAERATLTIVDLQTMKRRKVLTSSDAGCKVRQGLQHTLGWGGAPPAVSCVAAAAPSSLAHTKSSATHHKLDRSLWASVSAWMASMWRLRAVGPTGCSAFGCGRRASWWPAHEQQYTLAPTWCSAYCSRVGFAAGG